MTTTWCACEDSHQYWIALDGKTGRWEFYGDAISPFVGSPFHREIDSASFVDGELRSRLEGLFGAKVLDEVEAAVRAWDRIRATQTEAGTREGRKLLDQFHYEEWLRCLERRRKSLEG